jgi:hypothetical protein
VLAAFLGTGAMSMPTAAKRYAQIQQARAVYALCHSDNVTLYGKTTRQRIGMQGCRVPVALYDLLDAIVWPIKGELRRKILEYVGCPILESSHPRKVRSKVPTLGQK